MVQECYRCFTDHNVMHRLQRCSICNEGRCLECHTAASNRSVQACVNDAGFNIAVAVLSAVDEKRGFTSDEIELAASAMQRTATGCFGTCQKCGATRCYPCLDNESMKRTARSVLSASAHALASSRGQNHVFHYQKTLLCTSCYWSTKPCTNPTCPNEVGVPTKRCGGCHINRYCSVECQTIAYPHHAQKCKQIQEERTAAELVHGDTFEAGEDVKISD